MKNSILAATLIAAVCAFNASSAQVQTAGFDDLTLETNSYWIGTSHGSSDFTSAFAHFSHFYDSAYFSWNGFAYSNVFDTTTEGWVNQYACRPGTGAEGTENYGIYYQWANDSIWFDESTQLSGMFVTNSTYAALAMQNGDAYSKKFGGESGDDPDWLLLTITGFGNNGMQPNTIEFYLADYRFEDNAEDYIVTDWQWVDLTSLGVVQTLKFELTSSDNGDWGMNTPAYFCLDEMKTVDATQANYAVDNTINFKIYPNPFAEIITVETENPGQLDIYNVAGEKIYHQFLQTEKETIELSMLNDGVYIIKIINDKEFSSIKIVKN